MRKVGFLVAIGWIYKSWNKTDQKKKATWKPVHRPLVLPHKKKSVEFEWLCSLFDGNGIIVIHHHFPLIITLSFLSLSLFLFHPKNTNKAKKQSQSQSQTKLSVFQTKRPDSDYHATTFTSFLNPRSPDFVLFPATIQFP